MHFRDVAASSYRSPPLLDDSDPSCSFPRDRFAHSSRTWAGLFLAVGIFLAASCGGSGSTDETPVSWDTPWFAPAAGDETVVLREADVLCDSCLQLALGPVLGDRSGSGYVVLTDQVVQDSLGRYWLGQYSDLLKVYDGEGHFVASVGREGQGPGEFIRPMPVGTDSGGMVHIMDPLAARMTVMDSSFQVRSMSRLPAVPWAIELLRPPDTYVINVPIRSTEAIGHPLHVLTGSEVVRSFGSADQGITDPNDIRRVITTDSQGRIYSASTRSFLIEVWDERGERITSFEGPDLQRYSVDGPDVVNAPFPTIADLYVDEGTETLWVLIGLPAPDWPEHMEVIREDSGRSRVQPLPGHDAQIYNTEIAIVHLPSRSIIARIEHDSDLPVFVGRRQLLEVRELDDGTPQLGVWKAEWEYEPDGGGP